MEIQTYRYQINFVCKGDLQKSPGPHAGRALAVTKIVQNSFKQLILGQVKKEKKQQQQQTKQKNIRKTTKKHQQKENK